MDPLMQIAPSPARVEGQIAQCLRIAGDIRFQLRATGNLSGHVVTAIQSLEMIIKVLRAMRQSYRHDQCFDPGNKVRLVHIDYGLKCFHAYTLEHPEVFQ